MKVVITGANTQNNGAQSMLYITVYELLKRDRNCTIYFATLEDIKADYYTFDTLYFSDAAKQLALYSVDPATAIKSYIKEIAKIILQKKNNLSRVGEVKEVLPSVDLIIDVSGFCYGDKWPAAHQEKHLDCIRLAKKYSIPMILMPQSFGPFEYSSKDIYLLKEFQELFQYPDIIFAREIEGYNLLCDQFSLKNVRQSTDLVLQNREFDYSLIFKHGYSLNLPDISVDAVAIIPNNKCFIHGESERIINRYNIIINELLSEGKDIYIFKHAGEDAEVCSRIYQGYKTNACVHLLTQDFSCVDYDTLVKKFQFVICSRFHGVVHAYRNGIPCIVLGWAIKYLNLAKLVEQEQYVFDVTDMQVNDEVFKSVTHKMIYNFELESKIIQDKVKSVQKDNCFSCLDEYFSNSQK